MDKVFLTEIRNEILFRVHKVLNDRYGESVPTSLWDPKANKNDALETIKRIESFKSDEDLVLLLETLRKTFTGDYGRCLSCRESVELPRLLTNPTATFCDKCERVLNPKRSPQEPDTEAVEESQASTPESH